MNSQLVWSRVREAWSMRRMVITSERGEFITEVDVEEHELVGTVNGWVQLLPAANIYIDGQLVPEEARLTMRLTMSSGTAFAPSGSAPAAPEPERLKDYGEVLQRTFDDLRKGYVQSLNDLQDCAQRFSTMWIEREQQFADEAARQRALTHQSLADVDLLGRSIKAVQLQDALAMSSANMARGAHRHERMTFGDLLDGVRKLFTGE